MKSFTGRLSRDGTDLGDVRGEYSPVEGEARGIVGHLGPVYDARPGERLRLDADGGFSIDIMVRSITGRNGNILSLGFASQGRPHSGQP